jgi:hypothetical protein
MAILIHKYTSFVGGLGDFFRAVIMFYALCKKNDIEYYVDLSDNLISHALTTKPIPNNVHDLEHQDLGMLSIDRHNEERL